ncbi:MAG: cell division topological specificity factor MinE [Firmicutes bacterium]|jgi:cell division topological specificity factor|nr:cell division topological specificity factor MinE [Bacillota bacterium]
MLEFLGRILGTSDGSKNKAKERLRLVLVHDRASLSPGLIESLKEELIQVISKYMDIDETGLEVNLDESDDSVALVANIPVKNVKRNAAKKD